VMQDLEMGDCYDDWDKRTISRKIMIWVNGNFIGTFPKTIAEIKIRKFGGKSWIK
jgi:hypothetical protein